MSRNNLVLCVTVKEGRGSNKSKIDRFEGSPVTVVKSILDKYVSKSVLVQMGELAQEDLRKGFGR